MANEIPESEILHIGNMGKFMTQNSNLGRIGEILEANGIEAAVGRNGNHIAAPRRWFQDVQYSGSRLQRAALLSFDKLNLSIPQFWKMSKRLKGCLFHFFRDFPGRIFICRLCLNRK